MRIRDVETKMFFAKYLGRLFTHNVLKDSQVLLPKSDYERRYGKFPRYFSGWYLFTPSKDLAPGELVHKKINGKDLVAYRDAQGKPVIHANRCPHLDGLFAPMGTVKDGRLTCAYHGFSYDRGVPQSGPREFREDPRMCIPCHPVMEVNDVILFWFDATTPNGISRPTWEPELPDVSKFPRRAYMRSITPTHMAPLSENIIDDLHFMNLHGCNHYKAELETYHHKHRFTTKNTMRVPAPKVGPFPIEGTEDGLMTIRMDSEFFGLGIHINYVQIGNFQARMLHFNTPIEDEITEWTLGIYMEPRQWAPRLDMRTFMNMHYPWSAFAQTYYLHSQDRRVFFETGEYRFYDEVPKGMEKVDAFRRWVSEELLGEQRVVGKHSMATKYVPVERLTRGASS